MQGAFVAGALGNLVRDDYNTSTVESRALILRGHNTRRLSFVKRVVDFSVATSFLFFCFPLLLAIWCTVRATSQGPGLFWSKRVGLGGRTFWMPKFRTMELGSKLLSREIAGSSDFKMTPIGDFLRRTSIDELPQLWSVMLGDMSLIGPRALLPNDIAGPERAKYPDIYTVRPGISGLAQIKGRNIVTPRRKALYDIFYVRRTRPKFDLWIFWQTLIIIVDRKIIK